ncbi:hypothetical protein QPK31_02865 [Massilia sp. YIM B02769]|uniref:hypothetical protein n=1 Tax=Massilia sp. YIM B02769 TaxID=3050129 RepID=UPI0025B686B4|nr:hypothetical protein [Massilia sp. YIM B02769]MDN4057159.1 hypothetical protein [Massilia sp. YIM B02769]
MATESADIDLITIITSSAFVAALVNVAWNALSKWLDRQREAKKEELKVAHVYHAVILHLETYAYKANGQLYDISVAMDRYRGLRDDKAFDRVRTERFKFEPDPDWTVLPISFVDRMKTFVIQSDQCDGWIRAQFDLWAGIDEAFELEEQRIAWYALRACTLASELRLQIEVDCASMEDIIKHFQFIIDRCWDHYKANNGTTNLVPELRAHFASTSALRG